MIARRVRAGALIVLCASVSFTAVSCFRRPVPPPEVSILFTGDTAGNLDKCRCRGRWVGGIARRATAVREKGAARPGPTVVLDVGNMISAANDVGIKQLEYLMAAYDRMGYAAVNVGRREAQLDLETLRAVQRLANVSFTSANVLAAETGEPAFRPWVVVELGGHTLGVIGVLSDRDPELKLGTGLQLAAPAEALRRQMPQLSARCSLVVVLACAREEEMKALAEQVPEVDVFLGGEARRYPEEILRDRQKRVLLVGNVGKDMGFLHLQVDPLGRVLSVEAERVELGKGFDEDEEMLGIVKQYKESLTK